MEAFAKFDDPWRLYSGGMPAVLALPRIDPKPEGYPASEAASAPHVRRLLITPNRLAFVECSG